MDLRVLQNKVPSNVLNDIPSVMEKFGINTPLRLSHFLSNVATETGDFKSSVENLNYSAEGLLKTFPNHFTKEQAAAYAHNPEKIANRVYANRYGNGDESSGDGYRYCGRGDMELTFKDNYYLFDDFVPENILENPTLVKTKYALLSSAWFWSTHKLNSISDLGDTDLVITKIRHVVNGGSNGLPETIKRFHYFYSLLKMA